MKIARIALKDMGLLQALEVRDLSPGLNLLVGPVGSGKSTIRRAIGGIFYGFDDTNRRRLFGETRDTARGSLELSIGNGRYQLERYRDNWNASTDTLRNISSGTSSQSLARTTGNLHANDYFTFFNFSLIDSPDLERRMVRSLTDRMGVASGQSHWSSEAEYLRWRDEAQARRQRLDVLESQHRSLVARQDGLLRDIKLAESSCQSRLEEVELQLDRVRHGQDIAERSLLELREQLAQTESQIESLRREIERRQSETVTTEISTPRPDGLTQLYQRLDRVEREIKSTRRVQRDISRRRSDLREQRLSLSDHEVKARNSSVISARQHLGQLEERLDHLSKVLQEVARFDLEQYRQWAKDSEWKHLTPSQQFDQARDDLYTLCQDLSKYHLQMARGRLSAEARDMRRCAQEMKRRIAWLKVRRRQILHDLKEMDPAGYELIQRGEKRFCDCARHSGHLEARRRFLETPTTKVITQAVDTRPWEEDLAERLRLRERLLDDIHIRESEIQRCKRERDDLLAERQRILDGLNIDHLRSDLREVEKELQQLDRELPALRSKVAQDNPLWNQRYDNLLDRASQLCRQLTGNSLHRIWIDRQTERLSVADSVGKTHPFEDLGRSDQDLVCLSLSLAVARRMMSNGYTIPLVYDDLFVNLDDHRTQATCEVLQQFVADGQQIILLANVRQIDTRYLTDRFRNGHWPQPAMFYLPDFKGDESLQWPVVLLPGGNPRPLALPQPVLATPVVTTKLPLVINELSRLAELDLIERDALAILSENQILTVSDLLDLDPDNLPVALTSRGITASRVDRWQSQAWLLCCVPGLRPYDARLLVGSGINEPEMLEDLDAHDVLERLERYLATGEGQRVMRSGTDYELARVNSWMRSLRDNRSTWRRSDNRSGNSRYLRRRRRGDYDYQPRTLRADGFEGNGLDRSESVRIHRERDEEASLVFYLDLDDDLEFAPSIGPKMAERFAKIDILTVQQFLTADADEMAKRLDHRRVNESTIRQWQYQAKLVCQIPNLRGHDAQLLVACEIKDPETLIHISPNDLYSRIVPFSESREGQRILRSAKAPDMEEIQDWIAWARLHRPLQVA